MQLIINTEDLTDVDKAVLSLLLGGDTPSAEPEAKPKARATAKAVYEAEEEEAPAPKASAKKTRKAPEPEPEEAEEDDEADDDAPTRAQAVDRATELISSGKAAQVKAALKSVGASRVSDVADDRIADFMEAMS